MRLTMLAYNRLPLSLAYPISRAAAPLFVGMMQILVFSEEAANPAIILGIGVTFWSLASGFSALASGYWTLFATRCSKHWKKPATAS